MSAPKRPRGDSNPSESPASLTQTPFKPSHTSTVVLADAEDPVAPSSIQEVAPSTIASDGLAIARQDTHRGPSHATGRGSSNASYVSGQASQPTLNFKETTVKAGRDVKLTINNNFSGPVLCRLQNHLQPVAAAHDSYSAKKRETCFEGTRVEILKKIEDWVHGRGPTCAPIYVLDGVAGIGKSTIAQTVAELAAKENILGASFFFKKDEEDLSKGTHVFPTITYQLACHNEEIADRVLDAVEKCPDIGQKNMHTQFSAIIHHPLQNLPSMTSPTLVVIDALDECEQNDAKSILELLGQYVADIPYLKFLITSRPEAHIQGDLDRYPFHERFHLHDIDSSIVESDIKLYLDFYLSPKQLRKAFPHIQHRWEPTGDEKQKLYGICGTLFIIASTATKFILDTKRADPEEQCRRLLKGVSCTDYSGSKYTNALDITYMHILLAALPADDDSDSEDGNSEDGTNRDDDWAKRFHVVLGAIITLQNPLPCHALAALLGVTGNVIEGILIHLHSLVAPSSHDRTFRIHHKSFPDFITSRRRIQKALDGVGRCNDRMISKFYLDKDAHHRNITRRCFEVMRINLKQNMCNLSSADLYREKGEIEDALKKSPIAEHVSYACLHWASHLYASGRELQITIKDSLCDWAANDILSWLETLSILGHINASHRILEKASSIIPRQDPLMVCRSLATTNPQHPQPPMSTSQEEMQEVKYDLETVLHDCARLVRINEALFKLSPMHVYHSGIPFTPVETPLYNLYHNKADIPLIGGAETRWSPTWAVLSGHSSGINSIAMSPDGSRLASGSDDKTVRLWDARSGSYLITLEGHGGTVRCVVFSPNGLQLASGSADETVRLWDAKSGIHLYTIDGYNVMCVAFSHDGSQLASGSLDNTVQLWDTKSGSHLSTLEGHGCPVACIAFSPDGSQLASGLCDNTVQLWDPTLGSHLSTLQGHSEEVIWIQFSPDGSQLASVSLDKTVQLWDAKLGSHLSTLEGHSDWVICIAFSPDGSRLASGSLDNTVRLWDAKSGSCVSTIEGHIDRVTCVSFSPDGSRLASGSLDQTVQLWDAKSGTHLSSLVGHNSAVTCIAFTLDGSQLASGSSDKSVRLWDAKSNFHFEGYSSLVTCIAVSPDGSQVTLGLNDKAVRLWDAKSKSHLSILEGHSSAVTCAAFSPDGSRLALGLDDSTARVWDVKLGSYLSTLQGYGCPVACIAFSPDGSQLASGSLDQTVQLWDARSGSHLSTLHGHSERVMWLEFSPDGSQLASVSLDKTVRLWDAKSGSHLSTLQGHGEEVMWIKFSPDGSQLASGSFCKTVQLWDAKSGSHLSTLEHNEGVMSIAFSPDGSRLALGLNDKTVLLRATNPETPLYTFGHPYELHEFAFFTPPATPSQWLSHTATGAEVFPSRLLFLMKRCVPPHLYGLGISSDVRTITQASIFPICWFPADVDATDCSFAVNPDGTSVAIGCQRGRLQLLIIDISSITLP